MRKRKQKQCIHCKQLFDPDHRNYHHQQYCSNEECRKASKRASQKKWHNKPENRDYYAGSHNVQRVQDWRKKTPQYWRGKKKHINTLLNSSSDDKNSLVNQAILAVTPSLVPSVATSPLPTDRCVTRDLEHQHIDIKENSHKLHNISDALQDFLPMYHFVFIGLISKLVDTTLQDEIVSYLHSLLRLGQEIFPGYLPKIFKETNNVGSQATYLSTKAT